MDTQFTSIINLTDEYRKARNTWFAYKNAPDAAAKERIATNVFLGRMTSLKNQLAEANSVKAEIEESIKPKTSKKRQTVAA